MTDTSVARRALLFLVLASAMLAPPAVPLSNAGPLETPRVSPTPRTLPLDFVANHGQWEPAVKFATRKGEMAVTFADGAMRLRFGSSETAVAIAFEGAAPDAVIIGEEQRAGHYNFAVGNPSSWRSKVPAYAAVRYRGLYPGIDLRVREGVAPLEYELLLAPGSDLGRVVMRADGVSALEIANDGALVLRTPHGSLRQTPPITWEELPGGERRPLASRFRIIDRERYGFEAPGRNARLPMVIDPGLVWSTFLGGSSRDFVSGLAAAGDGSGDLIVAGSTTSADFPTSPSLPPGGNTMYVARLTANGSGLAYVTILGGTAGTNLIFGLASDATGAAVIAGVTDGAGFPTTAGAHRQTPAGAGDGFVMKLDGAGGVVFSTLLGGTGPDRIRAVAIDEVGDVIVGGWTRSADFPTTPGAYDTTFNTPPAGDQTSFPEDAFLTKLSADGSRLIYSTFFGGQSHEEITALAVDMQGFVTVVGSTLRSATGTNVPVTPDAFDTTLNGHDDVFLARFRLDGAGAADLKYGTVIGGDNRDMPEAVAVDPANPELVTVAGWSFVNVLSPPRYPTTPGAFKTVLTPFPPASALFPHSRTGFVTRFRFPAGGPGTLVWSTYFGGNFDDYISGLAVDSAGAAVVAGGTRSQDYPTIRGAYDRTYAGEYISAPGSGQPEECFVARISADGSSLLYSTFLGGAASDCSLDVFKPVRVVVTGGNGVAVSGHTVSPDFPATPGALQPAYTPGPPQFAPAEDGFVASFTLEPDASGDLTVGTPVLVSPANGAAFQATGNIRLRWNDLADPSGIEAYVYQISTRPDFARDFLQYTGSVSSPSFLARSLPIGTHYWRVQAADRAGNLGEFSPAFSFTTGTGAGQVVLAFIRLDPQRVNGGNASSGTLFLNFGAVAPPGGAVVTLASSHPSLVTVPASVTIPAGANSAPFSFTTVTVAATTSVTITGELGLTQTNTLTLEPPSVPLLRSLTISPTSVTAGSPATGTVTLSTPAPSGGAVVALSSNNAAATVPLNVTVAAGVTSATFAISTSTVQAVTSVNISAGFGTSLFATLTVAPGGGGGGTPAAPSLSSPANGATVTQPVRLDWSDVSGAVSYIIHVDDSSTFSSPLVVNQTVGVSEFTAGPLASRRHWWRVRAVNAAGTPGAWSTVRRFTPGSTSSAPALSTMSVAPSTVVGGTPSQATVTLTAAAPSGGALVTLASSNGVATVPASVTVAAGSTSATFPITTQAVSAPTSVTMTASYGGVTRTASLSVTPPADPGQAATLTVTATGRSGERVTSSPAGINVAVGTTASASFPVGTSITLSVSNGRDAVWSGACSSGGNKRRTCTFMISGTASVTANVQ